MNTTEKLQPGEDQVLQSAAEQTSMVLSAIQQQFFYPQEFRWERAGDIVLTDKYRVHIPVAQEVRTDLRHVIKEKGIIQPFNAIIEERKTVLIKGFERLPLVIEILGPDTLVPIWIITVPLTVDQVKKHILDLGRQKKKTLFYLKDEYKLYDQVVPSQQGKNLGGAHRFKLIAGFMGVSTGKLSTILRIDKVKPVLLQEVDFDHKTLADAEQEAKQIRRTKRKEAEENEKATTGNKSKGIKKVDLEKNLDRCPTCKRPFGDMKWEDIPELFTFKRDESNNQKDWLKPLTEEDEKEIDNALKTENDHENTDNITE